MRPKLLVLALFTAFLIAAGLPALAKEPLPVPPPPVPPPGLGIFGSVVDANTMAPLPSETSPYSWLELSQLNQWGNRTTVVWTTCNPQPPLTPQGCADQFGNWVFDHDYLGNPLPAGCYLLEVSTLLLTPRVYLLERLNVCYDGVFANVGAVELALSPVELVIESYSPAIPSNGGQLSWSYRLTNLGQRPLLLEAATILRGSGKTRPWTEFQAEGGPAWLDSGKTVHRDGATNIPAAIPDGEYLCGRVTADLKASRFSGLAEDWFCTLKGGVTPVPPPATSEQAALCQSLVVRRLHIQHQSFCSAKGQNP